MNARERFIATIKFEKTDRLFRWESVWIWPTTIARWKSEGLPDWVNDKNYYQYFEMDKVEFIPNLSGWGGTPFYPLFERRIIHEDDQHITAICEDGITKRNKRIDPETSMPQFLKFPVETLDDFKAIEWRLNPQSKERLPVNWETLCETYKHRDYPLGLHISGSYAHPRNLMGDENLMYALYDEPELIHAILVQWLELYKGYITMICNDVIPDFVMIFEDMAYRNASLISPEMFREFMLPYLTELISFIKNKGIPCVILDSDGNINELIPLFLEAGVEAIYPFEVQAGMDIVETRKKYGDKLAIIGGIDKYRLSISNSEIDIELEKRLPYMLETKGYLPMLDHSCPPNVSLDAFNYYIKKLRSYPCI